MKLPLPFRIDKKKDLEYYLAMLLTDEKAVAVILEERDGKVKIVNSCENTFPGAIESISQEELIETIDKSIGKAEEVLPPNIETHNTVFGVKGDWVEEETKKIKKDYLHKLKNVCDTLDLTPIGFMVTTEAISNFLQQEEGAPVSAVLAEVTKRIVTLTLFRGGKIVETINGPLEHSASQTVDKLLKHFTIAVLPARIILSASNSEEFTQQFISHQWSKGLPFLHVPQITALPEGFDAKAVTFGAAVQMGFELTDVIDNLHASKPVTYDKEEMIEEPIEEKREKPAEEQTEKESEKTPTITADNFGFVVGQDIALIQNTTDEKNTDQPDALKTDNQETSEYPINLHTKTEQDPEEESDTTEGKMGHAKGKLLNMLGILSSLSLPKIHMPFGSLHFGKRGILIVPLAILTIVLLLGVGIVYAYLYKVHATVLLTVKPKMVQQDEQVTFSTSAENNSSQNIIAAKNISVSVDGDLSTNATGKKQVGDNAKGTVTLYNSSTDGQNLNSGSTIKSSNGLIFTLDKSVSVASATGDIFSGTKPGTTQVSVTAKNIGTEYNLPSATTFSVDSSSSLAGKNDSAFSGGSKKDVVVISKDDIAKLKNDLPKNLENKGRDMLSQKADSNQTILPLLLNETLGKSTFDNNVGDQAKTVKLSATVDFEGMSFTNSDLTDFAKSILKNHYSQDISFAENSIKGTVNDPKQKSDKEVSAKVSLEAGILPNIDSSRLLKEIKDTSPQKAKQILSGVPQIANVQITYSPNLFFFPQLSPRLPKNVTIVVKPEN